MSKKLTTGQIVHIIKENIDPEDWAWEMAIEQAVNNGDTGTEDATDAALFLEKLDPGKAWSAEQYHGLMYHHFTGRWESAAHIGAIRAHEKYDELAEKYADDPVNLTRIATDRDLRVASDEAAEKWIRSLAGTYVFDTGDGTVLTFDRIFGGIIDEEEPV